MDFLKGTGFRFKNGNYVPETTAIEKLEEKEHDNLPVKAQKILIDFEEGGDPRSISKRYHFNSVEELGEYLENHNLYWNSGKNKYELQLNIRSLANDDDKLKGLEMLDISEDSDITMLSSLVEEYSESKGISQKNMLQIAMVEFLMNHGYKEEIKIVSIDTKGLAKYEKVGYNDSEKR